MKRALGAKGLSTLHRAVKHIQLWAPKFKIAVKSTPSASRLAPGHRHRLSRRKTCHQHDKPRLARKLSPSSSIYSLSLVTALLLLNSLSSSSTLPSPPRRVRLAAQAQALATRYSAPPCIAVSRDRGVTGPSSADHRLVCRSCHLLSAFNKDANRHSSCRNTAPSTCNNGLISALMPSHRKSLQP